MSPDASDVDRIVPIPQRCRSVHGVFTREPIDGSADFPAPAAGLLKRFGASDEETHALGERTHLRMFMTDVPTGDAQPAARGARDDAAAFAAEHDGVLVDLAVPRIVQDPAASGAASWVAVDVDPIGLTTRGLEAFGLPELRADGIEAARTASTIAVLLGLSQRLMDEWPAHDPVGPAAVTLHDIALAYDDQVDETGPERSTDLLVAFRDGELVLTLVGDPVVDLFS